MYFPQVIIFELEADKLEYLDDGLQDTSTGPDSVLPKEVGQLFQVDMFVFEAGIGEWEAFGVLTELLLQRATYGVDGGVLHVEGVHYQREHYSQ